MNATIIKQKIAMLKSYAHVFEFTARFSVQETQNYLLAALNDDDTAYYLHLITYFKTQEHTKETCHFKELSLQTDRLYFLEVVNSFIANEDRLSVCMSLLGRRQFSLTEYGFCTYGCDCEEPLHAHLDGIRENPKKYDAQHFLYQRTDANLNLYDAKVFEFGDKNYALLQQTSVNGSKRTHKEYLVLLSQADMDKISNIRSPLKIIDLIFTQMGIVCFDQQEYETSTVPTNGIDSFFTQENEEEQVDIAEFLQKFQSISSSPLRYEKDNLAECHDELYGWAFKLTHDPANKDSAKHLASALERYAKIINQEGALYGVYAALVQLSSIIKNKKSIDILREDQGAIEILLDFIEDIHRWQETLFDDKPKEFAYKSADLINNGRYLMSTLDAKEV